MKGKILLLHAVLKLFSLPLSILYNSHCHSHLIGPAKPFLFILFYFPLPAEAAAHSAAADLRSWNDVPVVVVVVPDL